MKNLIFVAIVVLLSGRAFAEITECDTNLRQKAQGLLLRCSNGSAEYCMRIGDGFYLGWIERNGEKVDVPQSEAASADFYAVACSKGLGKACGFAADSYMRLGDPSVPERTIFLIAQKGCALEHGASCSLTGRMSSKGYGTEVNELAALSHFTKACELGNEDGCSLQRMTTRIVELTHGKDKIDKILRELEEAQQILSDPDLNK